MGRHPAKGDRMSRGQGRVFLPTVRGGQTAKWWLDYSVAGDRHRESSGTSVKKDAQRMLRQRLQARETGKLVGRPDRVVLAEYVKSDDGTPKLAGGLRYLVETQYTLDRRRSITRARQCWAHLETFLGASTRALDVTPQRLDAYAASRMEEGASRQTANNELSILRRGYKLAIEKSMLATMPPIKLPKVRNARSGFFEPGDFAALLFALLLELPAHLRAVIAFARLVGWRISEILTLTWDAVDWEGQVLRLAAPDTKGGDSRLFPFGLAPELKQLLEVQWANRRRVLVFHHKGKRLGCFRRSWKSACKRAGVAGRLVHDLRRTAARDLRRAGVSEGEIMRLCGWKTRSMFDRYNIIDEADLAAAVAKRFAPAQGGRNGNGQLAANIPGAAPTRDSLSSSGTTRPL